MADNKLTDLIIRRLKPPSGTNPKKIADGHGLTLVISPAGGRWWEYRYRFGEERGEPRKDGKPRPKGKPRILSLGHYPVVTLAEAREKHLAARKLLAAGLDPAAEKKAAKAALKTASITFEQVAASFIQSRREHGFNDRADAIWGRLQKHVFPALGARPIGEITTPEILAVLLNVKRLGIDETARRCRQYIGQTFQHAIVQGWAERNPAADLQGVYELKRRSPVKHMRATRSPAELGRLLLALEGIGHTLAGRALNLLPYVFVRPNELAGARWDEIDRPFSLWRIPSERMKMKTDHLVPLAHQVKERLEALKELTGGGLYCFPGFKGGQVPMRPETMRLALVRLGFGPKALGGGLTSHGFRSVASTLLRERGFDPAQIELQLGHQERNAVTAAYNFAELLPQRRDMMQAWADYLDELREAAREEAGDRQG